MTSRLLASIVVAALSLSAPRAAQQAPNAFRAGVDAVVVPVSVTDGNRPVVGLTAADFELRDNGVVQEVASVSVEALSTDVTLVVDASGSVRGRALDQFKADVQAIAESLHPNDRVRLLMFATDVFDASGLQPGGTRLPVEVIDAGGATSLYNALGTAFMLAPQSERPHLIFGLTDGRDSMSFLDAPHVVSLARRSSASLHLAIVGSPEPDSIRTGALSSFGTTPFEGAPNRRLLCEAVAQTGGAMYERRPGNPFPALFRQVLDDFRTTYLLTYTPRGVTRPGPHEILVRTREPRHTIRAPKGYDGG